MINKQQLRDDHIAKLDALGVSLDPIQVTTDTSSDAMKCVMIDRGLSSFFLPLFHYPFCDAALEGITKSSGDGRGQSHHFESELDFFYVACDVK
jgi:hypothetical protein